MVSSLFGVYSEFNTSSIPMPTFVKLIWYLGVAFFLLLQFSLLLINSIKINKYVTPIAILLYLLCCLTIAGFPVIKLRMFIVILLALNINLIDIRKLIKVDFFSKLIGLLILFSMYVLNFFPSKYVNSYNFTRDDGTHRSTWGFNHPNTLGEFYLYFLISAILILNMRDNLSFKKNVIYSTLIFISGGYIELFVTDSRSSQVALIIIFIGWIVSVIKKVNCPKPVYGIFSLFFMIILSIVLDFRIMLNIKIFDEINHLFSNRLVLQNQALMKYGVHIFGNKSFKLGQPFWIDNQYIYNLLAIGIIGSLIFVLIFYIAFKNVYQKNSFILYVILISIVVKAMFESTVLEYCALLPIIYSFVGVELDKNSVYKKIYIKLKGVLK